MSRLAGVTASLALGTLACAARGGRVFRLVPRVDHLVVGTFRRLWTVRAPSSSSEATQTGSAAAYELLVIPPGITSTRRVSPRAGCRSTSCVVRRCFTRQPCATPLAEAEAALVVGLEEMLMAHKKWIDAFEGQAAGAVTPLYEAAVGSATVVQFHQLMRDLQDLLVRMGPGRPRVGCPCLLVQNGEASF